MKFASLPKLAWYLRAVFLASALIANASFAQPWLERSAIAFHSAIPDGISFRQQHVYQKILSELLEHSTGRLPHVTSCALVVWPLDLFGDFSLAASHPDPTRRLNCLRGAVDYLLQQTISEFDFAAARQNRVDWSGIGVSKYGAAQRLAFLSIYQKYSPLHQIHSVGTKDISDVSFDEFDAWLRRSREQSLITFGGKRSLLEDIDLPVPDPMVLQTVASVKSPRVPAGVIFFDGERLGVHALIMVSLDPDDSHVIDQAIGQRLSCNRREPSRLGEGGAGDAIADARCHTYWWFGDVWFALAVIKSDRSSYQDFCQQVQSLTKDADVAAVARGSPEGSKGLYVLLPPKCESQQ